MRVSRVEDRGNAAERDMYSMLSTPYTGEGNSDTEGGDELNSSRDRSEKNEKLPGDVEGTETKKEKIVAMRRESDSA